MPIHQRRTPARLRRIALTLTATAVLVVGAACDGTDDPRPRAASPVAAADTPAPGPLTGRTVVIDPGHNGGNADAPDEINAQVDAGNGDKACDTTGTATDAGYPEHAFNFDVAVRLAESLREAGATVVLTRENDDGVGPCITERTAVANDLHADVSVSIHADGGPPTGRGFHIMEPVPIDGLNEDVVSPSHDLAVAIADAIADGTELPRSDYIGDDGINPRDDMGGLNLTTVPKVMLECGNMRNAQDAALLSDADFRASLAAAIHVGVHEFLED